MKTSYLVAILILAVPQTARGQTPAITEAPPTIPTRYVEPSATRVIQQGEKIDRLMTRWLSQPYVLQKISNRTYWVSRQFYNATFYVGDRGVLLLDPPEGRTPQVLEAIRSVTELPVTAIVYSHNHADHVAGARVVVEAARRANVPLRIIATQATANKQAYLKSQLPEPTDIISWPKGSFMFEDLKVEVQGFDRAAHTDDHSLWLLTQERVLHSPDLLNPDHLPFLGYAVSENFIYHEANLKSAAALDWDFFNGGHGNVGTKKDFEFQLQFNNDLRQAILAARQAEPFGQFMNPPVSNSHAHITKAWRDAVTKRVSESLRGKYGQLYGYDASMPMNVELVLRAIGSYQ
jgi:glyoxylase-like metal-dependent hydrolase (beta-lactamase superfamily II)